MAEYHKYVFDAEKREFAGKFEEMYKAEKERYPDINFNVADQTSDGWDDHPIFKDKNYDCIVTMD
ncbi:MAG TPA: hypothetical protein VKL21_01725 [Candidatus Methanoperedens sp.]|nr:hypothetical protein [Candidatus Methanoperedens sp.]